MRLLKLLLSSSIIYIATNIHTIAIGSLIDKKLDIVQCNALSYSLSDNIFPLHYNIKLSFIHYNFMGEYVITIYIIHATQHINFHLSNLIIKSIISLKSILKQTHSRIIYEPTTNYNFETNIVLCNFDAIILPGIYNLHIRFKIPINIVKESFGIPYINQHGHKEWLITTGIQTRKQQIFPFWNKPELRITFDISIKHYQSYKVLSNMPIRESEPNFTNTWTHFNKTVLNSIDNVAFIMFDFHRIILTDTISMWCRPQLIPHIIFASHIIKIITIHFENFWNNSKRFLERTTVLSESKVDHIAIPNLQDEVKQVLGFVFHRETDIMYNEELDTIPHKMIIARLVAHRLIQKYIGNLLCPSYWFQLWLNKGFIMFFQAYIINEIMPDFRVIDLFVVQIQHELLDLNIYISISSVIEYDIYHENYIYNFLSHVKGSIIWRMLERTMLPNIFLKAINIYLNQYAEPMETTSDNLWNAMQSIIDKLDSEYQFNIKNTVYSWAMQRCFPLLEVMRNYSNNSVIISAQFHKLDEKQYYIPITYTTEQNPNFITTWSNIWLTPSNSTIKLSLEKDKWIILNLQQAGYYRVNYDTENWRKIARYLNSEEYKNIHVLNRAQIIDDAFHFAIEKKLEFSIFWKLAIYLQKEKDYVAWYPMIKAFEFMSNIFVLLKFYPEFQGKLKLGFVEAWKLEIDLWHNDDYFECLNQELAKWKCIIYDVSCKIKASQLLLRHLRNPKQKFLYARKRWTYCNGLRQADSLWKTVFNNFMKEMDRTSLECLAYSENSEIIINYLEEKLPKIYVNYLLKLPSDQINSIEALMANIYLSTIAKNVKFMLKDILNNFQKIKYRLDNKIATLIVIINNVYSKKQLNEINAFIRDKIKKSKSFNDMERKLRTRWSEINRQIKYFQLLFNY